MKTLCGWMVAVIVTVGLLPWAGCAKKASKEQGDQGEKATQPTLRTEQPTMQAKPHHVTPSERVAPVPVEKAADSPAAIAPAAESAPASQPAGVVLESVLPEPITPEMAKMQEQFGLVVTTITAQGKAIEVRFMVSTPEKAGQILSPAAQRYLIDKKSGTKVAAPTSPRTSRLRPMRGAGGVRDYVAIFDNSSGLIKPGDKVSLTMDEYHVEDLTVR